MVVEGDIRSSFPFEVIDNEDSKYLCQLSTILVATIQELKDRVSQIEFVFCNQLFPSIQSKSRTMEARLADARKAAEDDWKSKEVSYLNEIDALCAEKKQAQEHISQLNDSLEKSMARLMSNETLLNKAECEKKQLLDKLGIVQSKDIVADIIEQLGQTRAEAAKEKKLHVKLQEQIKLKDQQIVAEQRKRKLLCENYSTKYKHLKSQYNFLVRRAGLATEIKEEEKSLSDLSCTEPENQLCSKPSGHKVEVNSHIKLEGTEAMRSMTESRSRTRTSSISHPLPLKPSASGTKPPPLHGKDPSGPGSSWRNTRSPQVLGATLAVDPHDDFLDTPMENIMNLRGRRLEVVEEEEEPQELSEAAADVMDFNNSNDETQEAEAAVLQQQPQSPLPQQPGPYLQLPNKSFKYVEPVRKKAERESLQGVECKQCKKFYDAVLPDGGEEAGNGNQMRCEHHEGVSRHRYRYAPPMTPEGFWNIGFDSDF